MRNSNQNRTAYSQELPQDDTLSSSFRKLKRSGEFASSASGNWSEVRTFKSEGQGWNSTICKSPTIEPAEKVEAFRRGAMNRY